MIRMAVHAEILDTCKEIKFQKAISDPLKAGSYKDLCKQQNLQNLILWKQDPIKICVNNKTSSHPIGISLQNT